MTHIIFVKKILADGQPCKKCADVTERLVNDGLMESINHIAIADQRDSESEGMRLAIEHKVERAPFFVIETNSGKVLMFDIYFKFKAYMTEHANNGNTST